MPCLALAVSQPPSIATHFVRENYHNVLLLLCRPSGDASPNICVVILCVCFAFRIAHGNFSRCFRSFRCSILRFGGLRSKISHADGPDGCIFF